MSRPILKGNLNTLVIFIRNYGKLTPHFNSAFPPIGLTDLNEHRDHLWPNVLWKVLRTPPEGQEVRACKEAVLGDQLRPR